MNDLVNESIENLVNDFSASNTLSYLVQHLQAKNGKQYLLLLVEEGSDPYNKYFKPMLDQIPKATPPEEV